MLKVKTIYGEISGEKKRGYASFKGIPYAKPPEGSLRFAPPDDPEAWEGVRDGSAYGPPPMQMFTDNHVTQPSILRYSSEDCLYLNINTPAPVIRDMRAGAAGGSHPEAADETIDKNAKLPVYVFIHGGAYETGGGNLPLYDGGNFARQGIVYVNINYRLNVFGSLALKTLEDESGVTGCYAVLDALKALEWVHGNIGFFGGDPDMVTVGGESAGAFTVSVLMGMPAAKGLFRSCILESGSILAAATGAKYGGGNPELRIEECRRFAAELGVMDTPEGISLLRSLSAEDIIFKWFYKKDGSYRGLKSDPVLKNLLFDTDRLPSPGSDYLNDVNLLFGFNSDEGTMFADPEISEEGYESLVREHFGRRADDVLAAYPADGEHTPYERMADIIGLNMFKGSMIPYADALCGRGMRVYGYHFDYMTGRLAAEGLGCRHIAELNFVFNKFLGAVGAENKEGRSVARFMSKAWADFIRTGEPAADWQPYDSAGQNMLRIGDTIENLPLDRRDEIRFFRQIIEDPEIFKE